MLQTKVKTACMKAQIPPKKGLETSKSQTLEKEKMDWADVVNRSQRRESEIHHASCAQPAQKLAAQIFLETDTARSPF
jgi:hypothetical protein